MRIEPKLLGIHANPPSWLKSLYVALPFLLIIVGYALASHFYLEDNPHGKLLPSFSAMGERLWDFATDLDTRTETYLLWADTATSLIRFGTGLFYAAVVGLLLGLNIAMFPGLRYLALPGIVALSFIPVVTMLPILLVVVGIGEEAKILFIFLGLVFIITREMYAAAMKVPQELKIKARTLGASELALTYRIVLPLIMPSLIETVRLNLGLVWFCLIASEGIAANEGLGYRIFLLRRTSEMVGIIPYSLWITLLAAGVFQLLGTLLEILFPWRYERGRIAQAVVFVPTFVSAMFSRSHGTQTNATRRAS